MVSLEQGKQKGKKKENQVLKLNQEEEEDAEDEDEDVIMNAPTREAMAPLPAGPSGAPPMSRGAKRSSLSGGRKMAPHSRHQTHPTQKQLVNGVHDRRNWTHFLPFYYSAIDYSSSLAVIIADRYRLCHCQRRPN